MAFRGRPGNREPYREGPGRGRGRGWADEGLRITVPNAARSPPPFQNRERFYDDRPNERFDSRYEPPPPRRPATERLGPQHSERAGDSFGRNPVRDDHYGENHRGPGGRLGPPVENPHRPPMDRDAYRNPDRESDLILRDTHSRENMNPERLPPGMHDRHPPPRGDPFLREDPYRNPDRFEKDIPSDFPGRERIQSPGRDPYRRDSDHFRAERPGGFNDAQRQGDSLLGQTVGPRSILKNKSLDSLREPSLQGAEIMDYGHGAQQEVSGFSFDAGNVILPGLEQAQRVAVEIEDEDAFLYGEQPNELQRSQMEQVREALRDPIKIRLHGNRKQQPPPLVQNNKLLDDSWSDMDQQYEYTQPVEERPEEQSSLEQNKEEHAGEVEPESMLENILQSIGFDFELSKRMQELAKKKKVPTATLR